MSLVAILLWCIVPGTALASGSQQLFDTHIHYSHDARSLVSPEKAIKLLRAAGVSRAFVSSSGDEGTQLLYQADPDLVIPVLRPYRKRGELGTWMYDTSVPDMLVRRLKQYRYAGIGEFHAFGDDMDLPVLRQVVALAGKYGIFLHAHSDETAIRKIFEQDPEARVLWAHGGFEAREVIADMLARYSNLWCDLSFRYEHQTGGKVQPEWREIFERFPDRFTIGTDTYTPERWFEVDEYTRDSRKLLADLPREIAEGIAFRNAESLVEYSGFVAQ